MTEPVPGQTPEPAVTDAANATPPAADPPAAAQQPTETHEPDLAATKPGPAESRSTDPVETADPAGAEAAGRGARAESRTEASADAEGPAEAGAVPPNPQELFGSLSLSAIEADIDRLMNDKMSELDGMLAGLEDLVQRLEGEITNLEPPPDDPATP
ncbi:hypothetical protein ACRAKI_34725 [Saccharothrix isguenensis]